MYDDLIKDINEYIKQFIFFEFEFYVYNKMSLVITGSEDLMYYHTIEIRFDTVYLIIGRTYFNVDTKKSVFGVLSDKDEIREFNEKYRNTIGHKIFYFVDEDGLYTYVSSEKMEVSFNAVKHNSK